MGPNTGQRKPGQVLNTNAEPKQTTGEYELVENDIWQIMIPEESPEKMVSQRMAVKRSFVGRISNRPEYTENQTAERKHHIELNIIGGEGGENQSEVSKICKQFHNSSKIVCRRQYRIPQKHEEEVGRQ